MTRVNPEEFMPLRQLLARHPSVVEATRVAASLTPALCQFVVFERSWAYIVAASSGDVLQPRKLFAVEQSFFPDFLPSCEIHGSLPDEDLVNQSGISSVAEVEDAQSFPVVDDGGKTVCALTVHGPVDEALIPAFSALARLVSGIVATSTPKNDDKAGIKPEAIVDSLRDAVIIIDEGFDIIWANDAFGSLLGRSRFDLVGQNAAELIHPDDLAGAMDAIARVVTGLTLYRVVMRISDGAGGWGRVEITGMDQTANPDIGGIVMSLRSAELELELEQSQTQLRRMADALVEQLHDGIIATDAVGAISLVNQAAHQLFGISEDTPPGRLTWRDFPLLDKHGSIVAPGHHPARVTFGAVFDPEQEMSIVGRNGDHHYVSVTQRSVTADDGSLLGSFVTFHDVTATREAQNELVSQALHDQLTGLPNRRMLTERLVELKSSRGKPGSAKGEIAACFLDLDIFKLINDTHGHRTGDDMIRIAAERLSSQLREGDLLIRQGGDEFVALLVDVASAEAAQQTANRLRASLSEPFIIDGTRFDITASAGVALVPLENLDEDTLLSRADIALYAAKARGRNRTEVFDDALEVATEVEERQRRMLRYALDNDGIVMHFQPLIDSTSGKTLGFEALARLLDEEGTLHGPAAFLESIAGSGLVWELDQHAFKLSCAAAAVLASVVPDNTPTVSCNFSPLSIVQADFVSYVTETTQAAGVKPPDICIEITESAAFAGGEVSLDAVASLHESGFLVALDDFGTGYSSLSHLRDLPLASVKVDKSFIAKLTEQSPERSIAEAVVGLANDLGLGIVAEGVETEDQLRAAQDMGFNIMQGWHYAEAMPLDEVIHNWVVRPSSLKEPAEDE